MRNIILLVALLFNLQLSAQIILKGYIYDDISSETLIGANIIASNGTGTVSDLEGYFELVLPKGVVDIRVSYVGYNCLLYTSPSPRDLSTSRMPSSA